MIDFEQANIAFKEYLKDFNLEYGKNKLKVKHTYGVINASEYISKKLLLNDEDVKLAKLIALLHDIGRFEQIKNFDCFIDNELIDHAILGNEILFNNNLIRKFIKDEQYDNIISKAILNHNRLSIENDLNDKELLHAKIIRDADKIDNFRVKATEDFENIMDKVSKEILENDTISEKIFNNFMNDKIIVKEERNTYMDFWVSYIAFIFDFNYLYGLEYIYEKNYINTIVDRLEYKNIDTKQKMQKIKEHALKFINKKLTKN